MNTDNNNKFCYLHVRISKEIHDNYKNACKANGETIANNLRRYMLAFTHQYEEVKSNQNLQQGEQT